MTVCKILYKGGGLFYSTSSTKLWNNVLVLHVVIKFIHLQFAHSRNLEAVKWTAICAISHCQAMMPVWWVHKITLRHLYTETYSLALQTGILWTSVSNKQTKARKIRDFSEADTSKKGKQHLVVLAELQSAKEFKTFQVMLANLGFKLVNLEKWQNQNLICILVTFGLSQLSGLNLCKLLEGITRLCLLVRAFFFHSSIYATNYYLSFVDLAAMSLSYNDCSYTLLLTYICFICCLSFHNFSSLPMICNEAKVQRSPN